jgi:nucleotide-binding universal stress UspA family protein
VYGNQELGSGAMGVRPGNILVAVRDPRNLHYLRNILSRTDTTKQDVVVMSARLYHREHSFGSSVFEASDIFDQYEQELFTSVVSVAEKEGKTVSLLVVPGTDVFDAIMVTAQRLDSSRIVCGRSNKLTSDQQAKLTGDAWERLSEPRPRVTLEIYAPDSTSQEYLLGPHTPRMRPEDVGLMHKVWLDVTADPRFAAAHHYHVVALALEELQRELHGEKRKELLSKLEQEMRQGGDASSATDISRYN